MSFKLIVTFIFFTLLSVYFSFLNPHEVDIHFAQGRSFHLPMIVLFLGSVLLGILVAGFLHGTLSIKKFLSNLKAAGNVKRQNQANRKSEELLEVAENFFECGYISKSISIPLVFSFNKILNN